MTPTPAPTVGRIVHFTGDDGSGPYAAIVVEVIPWHEGHETAGGVALATLGPRSLYFQPGPVPYSEEPAPSTWRYPPRT